MNDSIILVVLMRAYDILTVHSQVFKNGAMGYSDP